MDLPSDLVYEVLGYLTVKDLYLGVALANSQLTKFTNCKKFIAALIQRDLNFSVSEPSVELSRKLLRCAACFRCPSRAIDFYGFATNGGVQLDNQAQWVRNMFEYGFLGYSSQERITNVNCAAVLDRAMRPISLRAEYARYLSRLETELEYHRQIRGSPADIYDSLLNLRVYMEMYSQHLIPECVGRLQTLYEYITPNVCSITKQPNTDLLLAERLDLDNIEASRHLCCIHSFEISRAGDFSCPVASLIIFCSMTYIPVNSQEFQRYDSLETAEQVLLAHNIDSSIPDVWELKETINHASMEFKPSSRPLVPVLWLRFKPDCLKKAKVELNRRFTCKFLYVKLVHSENRMEARRRVHDQMNIDIRHVIAFGTIFCLD